ncbi:MAG: Obg family GTPase CgtA, partial [Candidatus Dormibacteria bacterium]
GSLGVKAAAQAVALVSEELRAFSAVLAAKPCLTVITKTDLDSGAGAERELRAELAARFAISAQTGAGCTELLGAAAELVWRERAAAVAGGAAMLALPGADTGGHRVYRHTPRSVLDAPLVTREGEAYRVSSEAVERMVEMTDLDNEEALARLQRRMRLAGVDQALRAAGCVEGDEVRIGAAEFDWVDEVG